MHVPRELVVTIVKVIAAGLFATWSITGAALAASVVNQDSREQGLTILEGGNLKSYVLKPQGMLEGVCEKGCLVRLNDSSNDEYRLDGSETVAIDGGYLYFAGPDRKAERPVPDGSPQKKKL